MPIRSFIQPGAFDPEAIAAMSEAFEAALKELQDTGQRTVACDVIAGRIIAAARIGERERDPVRLRAAALVQGLAWNRGEARGGEDARPFGRRWDNNAIHQAKSVKGPIAVSVRYAQLFGLSQRVVLHCNS
jgi:hypothetical protein